MLHENLTRTIVGCAYRVHGKMSFGYLESVYEKCMMIELAREGLNAEAQKPIAVHYDGIEVGHFVADIRVEDTVIVELKSVRKLASAHEVQLVNYLVATGKPVGLLINFGPKEAEVKRKVRSLDQFGDKPPKHDQR